MVAFGDPSRTCAARLLGSIRRYLPDVPVCLCSDRKIGPEDVLRVIPDADIGGRRAKLRAYELAPAEWEAVLYLDADTEVVEPGTPSRAPGGAFPFPGSGKGNQRGPASSARGKGSQRGLASSARGKGRQGRHPVERYFEWIEDGWEFVICKDPHRMDSLESYRRRNNAREMVELERSVRTLKTLMWNGGVWAFARGERVARFFERWQAEWERHAQRDQGPLVRAMYADPLRMLVLGNQWNTFRKYSRGITTAGLMHYPGDARRWKGLIPGRIDGEAAWRAVDRYMVGWKERRGRRRGG